MARPKVREVLGIDRWDINKQANGDAEMKRIARRITRLRDRCSVIQNKIIPQIPTMGGLGPSGRANKLSYYKSQLSATQWALDYIDYLEKRVEFLVNEVHEWEESDAVVTSGIFEKPAEEGTK